MVKTAQTAEWIRRAFTQSVDSAARVRSRRVGLWQVDLPAYLADGDAPGIFVREMPDGILRVTDLGTTQMRVSYARPLSGEINAELARLAERQGLSFEGGELYVEVGASELLPAALGVLQVQAQADVTLASAIRRKRRESARFRSEAIDILRDLFGDRVESPYFDRAHDPEGLYSVDALIAARRDGHPLAVALVPSELEAERAVSAKLALRQGVKPGTRWVAVPRDLDVLAKSAQKRLVREYLLLATSFDDQKDVVRARLKDLAA